MQAQCSNSSDDGFTLVETLVSLALLALLAGYALNALSFMRDMRRVSDELQRKTEISLALAHMQRELEAAIPMPTANSGSTLRPHFRGNTEAVTFVILSDGTREYGGAIEVTYLINVEKKLVSRRRVWREEETATQDFVLLEGVTAVSFAYGDGASTWLDQDALPTIVEGQITLSSDATFTREFTARPKLQQ